MIIELEHGDRAQVTSGPKSGEYVDVVTSPNPEGYYTVSLQDGTYWDIHASQLTAVIEVHDEEEQEEPGKAPPFGMTSKQVAQYAETFLQGCLSRIEGIGSEQYARESYQKFETMNPLEVLDSIEEEILDIPNYCVFLYILIQRMKNGIGEAALG